MSTHIIVGGGSGIGANLCEIILRETNDHIFIFDKYIQKEESSNRVSYVEVEVEANLNWSPLIQKVSSIKSLTFILPACKSRDKNLNDMGFTHNYVENIGSINFSLLRLLECSSGKFAIQSSVVLVSSILGSRVSLLDAALDYHSSKAVLDSIVRYMALRLAPNTIVNGIAPGLIARGEGSVLLKDERLSEAVSKSVPLQRPCTQVEVATAIWTLASGLLNYVNGQIIVMDGGSSLLEPYSLIRSP